MKKLIALFLITSIISTVQAADHKLITIARLNELIVTSNSFLITTANEKKQLPVITPKMVTLAKQIFDLKIDKQKKQFAQTIWNLMERLQKK